VPMLIVVVVCLIAWAYAYARRHSIRASFQEAPDAGRG